MFDRRTAKLMAVLVGGLFLAPTPLAALVVSGPTIGAPPLPQVAVLPRGTRLARLRRDADVSRIRPLKWRPARACGSRLRLAALRFARRPPRQDCYARGPPHPLVISRSQRGGHPAAPLAR